MTLMGISDTAAKRREARLTWYLNHEAEVRKLTLHQIIKRLQEADLLCLDGISMRVAEQIVETGLSTLNLDYHGKTPRKKHPPS